MKCPNCGHNIIDKCKKYRLKRYKEGICARCPNKRLDNRSCCRSCLDKTKIDITKRRLDANSRNLQKV